MWGIRAFSRMEPICKLCRDHLYMDFTKLQSQLDEAIKIMTPKTAILWGREDLFRDAVERLLSKLKNWSVIVLSNEPREVDLMHEIDTARPDLVILSRADACHGLDLAYTLIKNQPNLNIITISSDSNRVEIYSRREISIRRSADLLSIIDQLQTIPNQEGGDWQIN